jgi:hypothetical protein
MRVLDLKPVPPVRNGLAKLRRDIAEQRQVFCVCVVGRDYHLGYRDAKRTLTKEVDSGNLMVSTHGDHVLYRPKPGRLSNEDVERGISKREEDLDRAEEILASTSDRSLLRSAFQKLIDLAALPATTGNVRFNAQTMTLIMERCFADMENLLAYLQNPNCLEEPDEQEAREFQREVDLRTLYDEKGEIEQRKRLGRSSPSDLARLDSVRRKIDELERGDVSVLDERLNKIHSLLAEVDSIGKEIRNHIG